MVYWKSGSRFKADPEKVHSELKKLGNRITPDSVVTIAKKSDTELHRCFTWDDDEAAKLYRLDEARSLMRSLVIEVERDDKPSEEAIITVRAYEHVTTEEDERFYIPTTAALKDPDFREQVMGRLLRTIDEAERITEAYEYLCDRFSDVRSHLEKAKNVALRV